MTRSDVPVHLGRGRQFQTHRRNSAVHHAHEIVQRRILTLHQNRCPTTGFADIQGHQLAQRRPDGRAGGVTGPVLRDGVRRRDVKRPHCRRRERSAFGTQLTQSQRVVVATAQRARDAQHRGARRGGEDVHRVRDHLQRQLAADRPLARPAPTMVDQAAEMVDEQGQRGDGGCVRQRIDQWRGRHRGRAACGPLFERFDAEAAERGVGRVGHCCSLTRRWGGCIPPAGKLKRRSRRRLREVADELGTLAGVAAELLNGSGFGCQRRFSGPTAVGKTFARALVSIL